MKARIILSAIFVLGLFLTSCEQQIFTPSGNITTIEKDITGFDALDVSHDFKVFVQFSDTEESVRIEADDNFAEYIIVEKIGSTLHISLKRIQNIRGKRTLNAFITTATLNNIEATGDSKVVLENELKAEQLKIDLRGDSQLQGPITANRLQASIGGDSKMTIDNMMQGESVILTVKGDSKFEGSFDVTFIDALLTGDSQVNLMGEADEAKIEARGDSKVKNYNFAIKNLDIILASDSDAYLTVTDEMSVKASGDSVMNYKGNPTINKQQLSGDSKVKNAN